MLSRTRRQDGVSSLNKYRIFETEEFSKKLAKLDARNSAYIKDKLINYIYPQIRKEPHFGKNIKKLKEYTPHTWRYRIGKFRVFYTIERNELLILMLTLDHRKDAYR